METELINESAEESIRVTNIVGETKKFIIDKPQEKKNINSQEVSDDDIRKAIERINPDPHSLKSRG